MKKATFILITFIVTIIPLSCEDSFLYVDCNKCFDDYSKSVELRVTIDQENPYVPITLYRGSIDKGEIVAEDTIDTESYFSSEIDFDEYYSAIAKYSHGGRVIFAVDGQKLRKKFDQNSCRNPCYIIKGDVLDLRLK